MNSDKLKSLEPLFGSWYLETKLSEGKSSKFYKVYKTDGIQTDYMGLKTMKFPSSEQELSNVIASGRYNNIDEYLDKLQQTVMRNMEIMRSVSLHQKSSRQDKLLQNILHLEPDIHVLSSSHMFSLSSV